MKFLIQMTGMAIILTAILFGFAGTVAWWKGWVFVVGFVAGMESLGPVFKKYPDLAEERRKAAKSAKSWDRVLVIIQSANLLPMVVLAGLDKRFEWTHPLPFWVPVSALVVMLLASWLTKRAMMSNPFFSSHVRIQEDRGHVVVSKGPYGYVRHPGYAGAILLNLAIPVLLGSLVVSRAGRRPHFSRKRPAVQVAAGR